MNKKEKKSKRLELVFPGLVGTALLASAVLIWNARNPAPSGSELPDQKTASAPGTQFRELPDPALTESDSVRRASLEKWTESIADTDMADALEQNESNLDPKAKIEIRHVLLSNWSRRDLEGAVSWFGQRPAADALHDEARELFGQALAGRDPAAMISWMEKALPEASRKELYWPFFRQWTTRDPATAAAQLRQFGTPASGNLDYADPLWNDLLGQAVAQWAQADVRQAVAWVQSLPDGTAKSRALAEVGGPWAEADPQAAAAYAALRPSDLPLLRRVADAWAQSDPQAAAAWAGTLPAGEAGANALAAVATVWSRKNPEQAAAFVASLPAGSGQDQAVEAVVSSWAVSQPTQAAKWVGLFPESPGRNEALQGLMTAWAENDATAAAQWLRGLPDTNSRDYAVSSFSSTVAQIDPGTAFQWAETISNETMRDRQLRDAAHLWLLQDSPTAQQKIAQSNLPQNLKTQLLNGMVP